MLSRFDFIEAGTLQRRRSGWPELWLFESDDRDEFIRQIRWFSSNYWSEHGRLLTPLVDGIRIRGPLFADFIEDTPKIAFVDGQGLGHTPDSSASVTTQVTRRFNRVDVILLVDNAQQPMQAVPLSVLRAVASSGHHVKLAIAFTHFDQIRGQNLRTFSERRAHVMASVRNAVSGLRDALGASVAKAIEQRLETKCFMLGGVDRQFDRLPSRTADYMRQQLGELVGLFEAAIKPEPPTQARPSYDPTGINFAVQEAVGKFHGPWLARLGLGSYEGYSKEHWSRVKALNGESQVNSATNTIPCSLSPTSLPNCANRSRGFSTRRFNGRRSPRTNRRSRPSSPISGAWWTWNSTTWRSSGWSRRTCCAGARRTIRFSAAVQRDGGRSPYVASMMTPRRCRTP